MGLSGSDYAARRAALLAKLPDSSAVVLFAHEPKRRNNDVDYPFRQESNFWYLTGLNEPEAAMVLRKNAKGVADYILFVRESCEQHLIWEGAMTGLSGAQDTYCADEAHPITSLAEVLPKLLEGLTDIYGLLGDNPANDAKLLAVLGRQLKTMRQGTRPYTRLNCLQPLIHQQRLIKSDAEIQLLRHAADASVAAHKQAIALVKPGLYEYHLESCLHAEFMNHGCRHPAYGTIVGSGANACVLHYTDNNQQMQAGDLVLVDAGAEYQGYAADITRTYPVSGKFSGEQLEIYQLVLAAQREAIAMIAPGVTWEKLQEKIILTLTEGLVSLGILSGDISNLIEQGQYRKFYMHQSGHFLGLDVHDVGAYRQQDAWIALAPQDVTHC